MPKNPRKFRVGKSSIKYNPHGLNAPPHFDYRHVSGGFYSDWGAPKILAYDRNQDYYVAWWGGHGVHAFDVKSGTEKSFWNIHSARDEPTVAEVKSSIKRRMEAADYP